MIFAKKLMIYDIIKLLVKFKVQQIHFCSYVGGKALEKVATLGKKKFYFYTNHRGYIYIYI